MPGIATSVRPRLLGFCYLATVCPHPKAAVAESPSAALWSETSFPYQNNKGAPMTNKEIIQDLYNGFASGDVAAVTAAFADDISWTEADGFPLAGTYVGPQAVVENVFMRLGEIGDNWAVVVERLVAEGDTVVANGKYTWNHKNSGEPCQARMAHVWTLVDGKATSFLQHVDTVKVREQMG
jgi:ketosteroid isomerase-like protein